MIPFLLANATDGQILTFDDRGTEQDQGSNFTASITSATIEATRTGMAAKLRRIAQSLKLGTSATVTITPIVDGAEITGDAQTFSLTSAVDGFLPVVESNLDRNCQTYRVKVEISAHLGETSLGPAAMWVIQKRSNR